MTAANLFAQEIHLNLSALRRGTLRFWGVWFGRPYDNVHTIVDCHADGDVLDLNFNQGELLRVWNPARLVASQTEFKISSASRVRWQWYYYGRPQTADNLEFYDFELGRDGISNVNWYKPILKCDFDQPAVEIL